MELQPNVSSALGYLSQVSLGACSGMGGDQGNAAAALRDGGIGRGQGLLCAGQLGLVHYPGKLGGH